MEEKNADRRCRIFGHDCPVFYVAEPLTETKELRRITRLVPRPIQFRVLKRDNQICGSCGKSVGDDQVHFDHIIPWAKGGPTEEHNIILLCSKCNQKKGAAFEKTYLVRDLGEHTAENVDLVFLEHLLQLLQDSHAWKRRAGDLPGAAGIGRIIGSRCRGRFEESLRRIVDDVYAFFEGPPPEETKPTVFRALRLRWGFEDGEVTYLSDSAKAYGVALDALMAAEKSLIHRLGWNLKVTAKQLEQWRRR
jgi:hypothetical protein